MSIFINGLEPAKRSKLTRSSNGTNLRVEGSISATVAMASDAFSRDVCVGTVIAHTNKLDVRAILWPRCVQEVRQLLRHAGVAVKKSGRDIRRGVLDRVGEHPAPCEQVLDELGNCPEGTDLERV